ncbi:MAG: MerC domain-containing protein [Bacteroidia bacterium]|nr:MerC domain-containing protein [Bacteroidia bacterium]
MHAHTHKGVNRSNRISALLSLACAIHCAAMPMLISILPLIGMQFLASHLMEGLLLAFGVGFGLYGVIRSYIYQHRDIRPVIALALGTLLIAGGFFFAPENLEPYFVSTGAIGIAIAQVLNIRSCKRCAHTHE